MSADIDQRFGRAKGFVIFDMESGNTEYVSNEQNLNAMQGAGIQTAENLSKIEADVVITGHCGPKAFRILDAAGIGIVVGAEGTVEKAITDYKEGRLKPADSADVESHWV